MVLILEVALAKQCEVLGAEELTGKDVIVGLEGNGRRPVRANHQRVGIVDIQLDRQENLAEGSERPPVVGGKFDDQNFRLAVEQPLVRQ